VSVQFSYVAVFSPLDC